MGTKKHPLYQCPLIKDVGVKKLSGTVFHASPAGVKHMDMLNNLFAQRIRQTGICSNKFEPTKMNN